MWFKDRISAPGPTEVPEPSRLAMARRSPYHRTERFSDVLRSVQSALRTILDVDWPVVTLASSGTGAMEMAAHNTVEPGETALVLQAGKFGERWTEILRRRGVRVHPYTVPWGRSPDPDSVGACLERLDDVRAVFGTLVETSTLSRQPVRELGEILRDRESLFVVDAISGVGAEEFSPEAAGVDLLAIGSQKALMAPPGLGFVTLNERAEERVRRVDSGGMYFDLSESLDRLQRDFQTPWTPALPLVQALDRSLTLLLDEGVDAVQERHRRLASVCRAAVDALGLTVFPEQPSVVGTALRVPDSLDGNRLLSRIRDYHGLFIPGGQKQYAGQLVRLGHMGHVDYYDLLVTLGALENGLRELGHEVEPGRALARAQATFRERNL